MNKNVFIIVGLLIIACLFGIYFWKSEKENNSIDYPIDITIQEPISKPQLEVPSYSNWKTFTNKTLQYSFKYPNEAEQAITGSNANGENDNFVKIVYMGKTQKDSGRTQTELFDGYMVNIMKLDPTNTSMEEIVTSRYKEADTSCPNPNEAKKSALKTIKIGGKDAKGYTMENCRADYENYYISHKGSILEITLFYTGLNKEDINKYKDIAGSILKTFEWQ